MQRSPKGRGHILSLKISLRFGTYNVRYSTKITRQRQEFKIKRTNNKNEPTGIPNTGEETLSLKIYSYVREMKRRENWEIKESKKILERK